MVKVFAKIRVHFVGDEVRLIRGAFGMKCTGLGEQVDVVQVSTEQELVRDAVELILHRLRGTRDRGHQLTQVFADGVLYLELLCRLTKAGLLIRGLGLGRIDQRRDECKLRRRLADMLLGTELALRAYGPFPGN